MKMWIAFNCFTTGCSGEFVFYEGEKFLDHMSDY